MKKFVRFLIIAIIIILTLSIAFGADDDIARPNSIGEPVLLMFLNK